jgi:ABC-type bacteriocin/lantibiotic exporter with double-glycine peptidase domain
MVGNAINIDIKVPPAAIKQVSQSRALYNIASASRVRMRKVALRGQWWKDDNGPLLAFLGQEQRPVALLPTSARGYIVRDPANDTQTLVTADLAHQLEFLALSFYRPFPNRLLKASDLIRFSLPTFRRDLISVILMGLLVGLLGIIPPIAIGALFDTIIPGEQQSLLLQVAALLLVVAFTTALFQIVRDSAVLRIEGKLETSLQAATIDRLFDLPPRFFRDYTSGDLGMRAM